MQFEAHCNTSGRMGMPSVVQRTPGASPQVNLSASKIQHSALLFCRSTDVFEVAGERGIDLGVGDYAVDFARFEDAATVPYIQFVVVKEDHAFFGACCDRLADGMGIKVIGKDAFFGNKTVAAEERYICRKLPEDVDC